MDTEKLMEVLKDKIALASKVFVIGHNNPDLDAIASCIGLSLVVRSMNREAFIVINDTDLEPCTKSVVRRVQHDFNIINKKQLLSQLDDNSLLIICDANKKKLVCVTDILDCFKDVIIIDHHDIGDDTIITDNLFIYESSSSTSEIVTFLIKNVGIDLEPGYATFLLSGIVLDTDRLTKKTSSKTIDAVYSLTRDNFYGVEDAQRLFKEDLKNYMKIQKLIERVEIFSSKIGISVGDANDFYREEDVAKASSGLMQIRGVDKASFVLAYLDKATVRISARSSGEINVGKIVEALGGGGSERAGAATVYGKEINEVYENLSEILRKQVDHESNISKGSKRSGQKRRN